MWLFSAFQCFIKKCQKHSDINFFLCTYPNYFFKIPLSREISGGEDVQYM